MPVKVISTVEPIHVDKADAEMVAEGKVFTTKSKSMIEKQPLLLLFTLA